MPGLMVLLTAATLTAAPVTLERELLTMGTQARVGVVARDRATALAAGERAVRALEEAEARLSTWRPETPLSRLNRAPIGVSFELEAQLAQELRAAVRCRDLTRGAFDPSVGPLVAAWGLRSGGHRPSEPELRAALAASGPDALEIAGTSARRLVATAGLEEGGFGKGAALDRALEAARDGGAGVHGVWIDLGGQISVWGATAHTLDLAHPRRRTAVVASLAIDDGSVATSGNSERGLVVEGERVGHLLDPRSGRPAEDFGSVTVWAPRGLEADCLATGLYVMGPTAARAWALEHPEYGVVLLSVAPEAPEPSLEVWVSPGLSGRLRLAEADEFQNETRSRGPVLSTASDPLLLQPTGVVAAP